MTIFKSLLKLNLILLIFFGFFLSSCGIHRPVDAKKIPSNAKDRVEKNIREEEAIHCLPINRGEEILILHPRMKCGELLLSC